LSGTRMAQIWRIFLQLAAIAVSVCKNGSNNSNIKIGDDRFFPIRPNQTQYVMSVYDKNKVRTLFSRAGVTINGDQPWDVQVHEEKFYRRLLNEGSLGFGESYVEGWWDAEALDECVFRLLRARIDRQVRPGLKLIWKHLIWRLFNMQSKARSKKAIGRHYDLDNDLFFSFLDPYHQYSCGYFYKTQDLATAQEQKLELICQKLQLSPGDEVLDIGCGWGGLAKYMTEHYGCRVTGITLSEEQARYAREFCKGLPVRIRLKDYRDVREKYDKIVSVGMFEHVGYKNHRNLLKIVRQALRDEGLFLLHTIGIDRPIVHNDPWMVKYIFPNSQIPSLNQLAKAAEGLFVMEDWHNFGHHYAQTLKAWHDNFVHHWSNLRDRYDERFFRLWTYYLQAGRGNFMARRNQLWQVVFAKEGVPGGYASVRKPEEKRAVHDDRQQALHGA